MPISRKFFQNIGWLGILLNPFHEASITPMLKPVKNITKEAKNIADQYPS